MALSKPKRAEMEGLIPVRLSGRNMFIKDNSRVLIHCKNNRKVTGQLKAVDSHCNVVLENAKETWMEFPTQGKSELIQKQRFAQQVFLKAEDVIAVYLEKASQRS